MIGGGVHGVSPDGERYASFNEGCMWTGGVIVNSDGAVLSTGEGGIMWNRPEEGKSDWLLREIDGQSINGVNEMWPDGTGGIYFGTTDIESIKAAGVTQSTAIYRLTRDLEVIKVAEVNFSNGIAFDRERARFYCSDTFNTALAWDVAPDLTFRNRRILLDKDDCDGLALEASGDIILTGFRSLGALTRLTTDGILLEPLRTPPGSTTQIRFGGADLCDFYINIVPADGGDSLKDGKPLTGGSYLYRGRSAVAGMAVGTSDFSLG